MIENKIEGYALSMLLVQLSFVFIGLTGIYPFTMEIAGFDVYQDIQETSQSIQTMYQNVAGEGALTAVAMSGLMAIMGVKIVLEFMLLTLTGAYPLMVAMGLPAAFALPLAAFLGAVILYGLAVKFLGR